MKTKQQYFTNIIVDRIMNNSVIVDMEQRIVVSRFLNFDEELGWDYDYWKVLNRMKEGGLITEIYDCSTKPLTVYYKMKLTKEFFDFLLLQKL